MAIDSIDATLRGLEPALRKMRNLAPKLKKKGLRNAARRGMVIVRTAAKANAKQIDDPETAESIQKNIAIQVSNRQSRKVGGVVVRVGVRGGALSQRFSSRRAQKSSDAGTNPGGDTRHWRFLEFGTSKIGARPFMLPALQNNIERVTDVVARELIVEIDKAIQ